MRKISLKSLQKLVSQASDFYGKSDLSPGDFFRYTRSPFLANFFLGIPCSDELFEKIDNDISAHNEFINNVEVDVASFVIEIDKKIF